MTIQVRSPPLLAIGLACLALSGALGAVLVHDGAVGTDGARLDAVDVGDAVRVKGAAEPVEGPKPVAVLRAHTVELVGDLAARVLVTSDEPLPDGSIVVAGEVLHRGDDPLEPGRALVVLLATKVDHPYLFG